MKNVTFSFLVILVLMLSCLTLHLHAQNFNCTFKEPIITIDFGSARGQQNLYFPSSSNYEIANNTCPNDGYYAFVSYSSGCFNNDWLTLNEDHTPGDKDGKMMLVNASLDGGVFFTTVLTGLQPNKTYEFAAWMTNVCRIMGGCPPLPPNITIKLSTPAGRQVALFRTGRISQTDQLLWTKYSARFTSPTATLLMSMEDMTLGGCGNDFALDDITIQECMQPSPIVKVEVKPEVKPAKSPAIKPEAKPVNKQPARVAKAIAKKTPPKLMPVNGNPPVVTMEKPAIEILKIATPAIKEKQVALPEPKPIATRANPLIKQIETSAGDIVIDLYDNGEIDGDTVTVYNNNELLISRAGLSAKPTTFRIKIDAARPHHEIIMVANNLGSIPPNTSMMIITTKDKRYEVFISSSEQKNAKVVIDLKE